MKVQLQCKHAVGREQGFTLLEYCVGAAAVLSFALVVLYAIGSGLETFGRNMGDWIGGIEMPNVTLPTSSGPSN